LSHLKCLLSFVILYNVDTNAILILFCTETALVAASRGLVFVFYEDFLQAVKEIRVREEEKAGLRLKQVNLGLDSGSNR
jgi:hypothetical protein